MVLFFLFPFALFASLNGNGDFQIWNTDSINLPISRKAHLTGSAEFRYGDNRSKLYYKHYQGGFLFIRSPHTNFHFGYRHIYNRVQNKWVAEYDLLFDLTFQVATRRGLLLSNRNRIQYRILSEKQGGHNLWLYRNRLEFIPPYRVTRRQIALFFANEFFWQERNGISQNRLQAGLKIPYHQRTHLNLSYMLRSLKNSQKKWVHHNILCLHFSLHF